MKRIKAFAVAALVLWLVALLQIAVTRVYVSKADVTQAFARNQVVVTGTNEESRNTKAGNSCIEGKVTGQLSREKMKQLAEEMFRSMGGGMVMENGTDNTDYYVAYGYTNGVRTVKNVNNQRINMNVAMSYDEEKGCTVVTMGTPLINTDF